MPTNRSLRWLGDYPNDDKLPAILKTLKEEHGPLQVRGRHFERKQVLRAIGKPYVKGSQNDVPRRVAIYVGVYRRGGKY